MSNQHTKTKTINVIIENEVTTLLHTENVPEIHFTTPQDIRDTIKRTKHKKAPRNDGSGVKKLQEEAFASLTNIINAMLQLEDSGYRSIEAVVPQNSVLSSLRCYIYTAIPNSCRHVYGRLQSSGFGVFHSPKHLTTPKLLIPVYLGLF